MAKRIIFNLKRYLTMPVGRRVDLYEEIKTGRKTSEFRDYTSHWVSRLFRRLLKTGITHMRLKVDRAWFVVGFPKNNLPRLEADIKGYRIILDEDDFAQTIEIIFENVIEVTETHVNG